MKQWQVDALRRLEIATKKMKRQILEDNGDWEKAGGMISLEVSKNTYNPDVFYSHIRISTRLNQYV